MMMRVGARAEDLDDAVIERLASAWQDWDLRASDIARVDRLLSAESALADFFGATRELVHDLLTAFKRHGIGGERACWGVAQALETRP